MTNFDNIHLSDSERWRLLLGEASIPIFGQTQGGLTDDMDTALSWLYNRKTDANANQPSDFDDEDFDRQGGQGASTLSTPEWINQIQTLFPKETIERLEKDAIEIYKIHDLITNPEVLAKATPNLTLLSAILNTKHLMNADVLAMARKLVAQVVKELQEKLQSEIIQTFSGKKSPIRYKKQGSIAQFAFRETIKRNLKNYQADQQTLLVTQPYFFQNEKNHPKKWQIILVIDQSGSMVSSVIHSAVMASCFWHLPNMNTHLIAFDTEVVDLTDEVTDPVELLMQVQLGGGTDIAKAMRYASSLVVDCQRSIVVLVSDFFEGGSASDLIDTSKALCEQGTKVLGLIALDDNANPAYHKELAQQLANVGVQMGAMTPLQLANWVAEMI